MIQHQTCDDCIHKNVCKQTKELQDEIDRVSKKNESEEQRFITIVKCNSYDSIANILLNYKSVFNTIPEEITDRDEALKILSSLPYPLSVAINGFRYECYFKNDIERVKNKDTKLFN